MSRESVKARLNEYYDCIKKIVELQVQITEFDYAMDGVRGVSYDSVHTSGSDRQTTLIRMIEKKDTKEEKKEEYEFKAGVLRAELRLDELTPEDRQLLHYAHCDRLSYEEIADLLGYGGKVVIYRKLRRIYDKIKRTDD